MPTAAKRLMKTLIIRNRAYALLEILIAIAVLSTALLPVYSSVSRRLEALSRTESSLKAALYCRNLISEFRLEPFKTDVSGKEIKNDSRFTYSIEIKRYENPLLGPFAASKVTATVFWNENGNAKSMKLSYIYPDK